MGCEPRYYNIPPPRVNMTHMFRFSSDVDKELIAPINPSLYRGTCCVWLSIFIRGGGGGRKSCSGWMRRLLLMMTLQRERHIKHMHEHWFRRRHVSLISQHQREETSRSWRSELTSRTTSCLLGLSTTQLSCAKYVVFMPLKWTCESVFVSVCWGGGVGGWGGGGLHVLNCIKPQLRANTLQCCSCSRTRAGETNKWLPECASQNPDSLKSSHHGWEALLSCRNLCVCISGRLCRACSIFNWDFGTALVTAEIIPSIKEKAQRSVNSSVCTWKLFFVF